MVLEDAEEVTDLVISERGRGGQKRVLFSSVFIFTFRNSITFGLVWFGFGFGFGLVLVWFISFGFIICVLVVVTPFRVHLPC